MLSTSAFSLSIITNLPVSLTGGGGGYAFLDFPFLAEVPVEAFCVLVGTPVCICLEKVLLKCMYAWRQILSKSTKKAVDVGL